MVGDESSIVMVELFGGAFRKFGVLGVIRVKRIFLGHPRR